MKGLREEKKTKIRGEGGLVSRREMGMLPAADLPARAMAVS